MIPPTWGTWSHQIYNDRKESGGAWEAGRGTLCHGDRVAICKRKELLD